MSDSNKENEMNNDNYSNSYNNSLSKSYSDGSLQSTPNKSINKDDENNNNRMKDILTPLPTRDIIQNSYNYIYSTPISSAKKKIIYLKPTPIKMDNLSKNEGDVDDSIQITAKNRDKYAEEAYNEFDRKIFKFKSKIPIYWSNTLITTAGNCSSLSVDENYRNRRRQSVEDENIVINKYNGRYCIVRLSIKIIDTYLRLRDTLIHELCHAAAWLNYGYRNGHRGAFTYYKKICNKVYGREMVTTYHNYKIFFKYRYECVDCHHIFGRHSKSVDVEYAVYYYIFLFLYIYHSI